MKKISSKIRQFIDLIVVPIVVVFLVFLGVFALKYKNSFPKAVMFTEYIVAIVVALALYYWLNRILKNLFHTVLKVLFTFIYGSMAFVMYWGVAVICLGVIYIFRQIGFDIFYVISYYLSSVMCFSAGAIATIKGNLKLISDKRNKIIIFNHASFIDYILIFLIMGYKHKWKVVIGRNLQKYWPFNQYTKRVGIFIDREIESSGARVLKEMLQAINDGYNVAIFPSAGRDRQGEIRDFREGSFDLALKNDIPIISVSLHDTGKYCPAGPKSKNTLGKIPEKLIPLIIYRLKAGFNVVKVFFSGKANHLLVSPRILKLKVLGEVNLRDDNGVKKSKTELKNETHTMIHKDLGNK